MMQHPNPYAPVPQQAIARRDNPYLPASMLKRTRQLFQLLYLFIFGPALIVTFAALLDVSPVFGVFFGLALLANVVMLFVTILPIFVAMARLRNKTPDALMGNTQEVLPAAHSALRWVFRGDIRMSAYYLIGMCAESRGDFADAAEAFQCALKAMPLSNIQSTKKRVCGLSAAHLAFCLAGSGRPVEAHYALTQAQQYLMMGPGAFDFMEPLNQGFTQLGSIEPGRDPRAMVALAGVATAFANGAHRDALDIITREGQALSYGVLPRERALVMALERKTRALLDGAGAMRGAAELASAPPNGDEAWAARYLSRGT
jgi:hypothetical protein